MAKNKKFTIDEKIRKFMESYQKDISEEINKAHMDSIVYGEGFLSIISTGGLKHIPYREIINFNTFKNYRKQRKVKKNDQT